MESYRVQQEMAVASNPVAAKLTKIQQASLNGDFFAAFLALITQDGEEAFPMLENADGEGGTEENAGAMELMADLLGGNYGFDRTMNESMKNMLAGLQSVNGDAAPADSARLMQEMLMLQAGQSANGGATAGTNMPATGELQSFLQNMERLYPTDPMKQSQNAVDTKGAALPQNATQEVQEVLAQAITATTGKGSSDGSSFLEGEMNFRNSILQAQRLMKNQAKETSGKTEETSDGTLQQAADVNRFSTLLNDKQVQPQKTTVDIADLAQQVKNGISTGIAGEQKEFSVKLKPDGMGEVVIKLVESQNRLTVNIVTATHEAAKMLNNELPNLREAMRAMQVEVKDVSVQVQNTFSDLQQNLQQQMFQGQSRHFSNGSNSTTGLSGFEDELEMQSAGAVSRPEERMNIYV